MKGLRWYKCDFHLHTSASKCFTGDKSLNKWIDKVYEEGLECIAVTDHNTAENIDKIKTLGKEKGIVVFPGVEITCSDAKVHMLVIFDINKDKLYVEDFLIKCNINRRDFGKSEIQSVKSIDQIVDIANEMGGIVIPAHIDDEQCSLESVGHYVKRTFLNRGDVIGVQVVEDSYLDKPIYKDVISKKCATLTFSDNPHKDNHLNHGIDGIGKRYTWIKLSQKPNLNSLRQAFIMSNLRVKNDFEIDIYPYKEPNTWIKKINVVNSCISENIEIEFSPQMNTIIGGRGSGKSSILKFIFGMLRKNETIEKEENLMDIVKEYDNFFKVNKDGIGVFKEETIIKLTIVKGNIDYFICLSDFKGEEFNTKIYTEKNGEKEYIEDKNFIYFLSEGIEVYLQKQIYQIAKNTNILKDSIDKNIDLKSLKEEQKKLRNSYISNMNQIKKLSDSISNKENLKSNLKNIKLQLGNIDDKEFSKALMNQDLLNKEYSSIKNFEKELDRKLTEIIQSFNRNKNIYYTHSNIDDELKGIIEKNTQNVKNIIDDAVSTLETKFKEICTSYREEIENSFWSKRYEENKNKISKLVDVDEMDILAYKKIIKKRQEFTEELTRIESIEIQINSLSEESKNILETYKEISNLISEERKKYLKENFDGTNSNLQIIPQKNRDKLDFENKFRKIIHKEKGEFKEEIERIKNYVFNSNSIIKNIDNLIEYILIIKNKRADINKSTLFLNDSYFDIFSNSIENISEEVASTVEEGLYEELESKLELKGRFKNILGALDYDDLVNLKLLIPEDAVKFKYRTNKDNKFKDIDTASAGQKTSAILTYILSKGTTPLVLDQPEDDLDNKIIYDLIINTLKSVKEERQIIVVTHNANIPVNGDSENVIAVDYIDKKGIVIEVEGSIEDEKVKNSIFDIMEGGEEAFEIRSKRYGYKV